MRCEALEPIVQKKAKKRPVAARRAVAEPMSYASVYAAKLAKQVAEFAPRQPRTGGGKVSRKRGRQVGLCRAVRGPSGPGIGRAALLAAGRSSRRGLNWRPITALGRFAPTRGDAARQLAGRSRAGRAPALPIPRRHRRPRSPRGRRGTCLWDKAGRLIRRSPGSAISPCSPGRSARVSSKSTATGAGT